MAVEKNKQLIRAALQKKVLKSEIVTLDELAEFATVVQSSGRLADRVTFAQAKKLLADDAESV